MRPYLSVLKQQLANSIAKLMTFRASFIMTLFVEAAATITAYLPASFLFDHVTKLGPWNRMEFMFFVFWIQALMCIHGGLAAPNFWNFTTEIRTGALDFRLVRPLGSLFDAMTAFSRPGSLLAFIPVVGCIIYIGLQLGLSPVSWLAMPCIFTLSFIAMVAIEVNLVVLAFWTNGNDGMNFLRMQCQQIQRWPDFMYPSGTRTFFSTALPVLASGSLSVRFLFDTSHWEGIIIMLIISSVFSLLASFLWKKGLQRYESASS